jgi:hypothetical protein
MLQALLQLDLPAAHLERFLKHVAEVGGGGAGEAQLRRGWEHVLSQVDGAPEGKRSSSAVTAATAATAKEARRGGAGSSSGL